MEVTKLKAEPQKAYKAFLQYLQLPIPRDLSLLAKGEYTLDLIEKYYRKWNWELRAKEYDEKNDLNKYSSSLKIYYDEVLFERIDVTFKNFAWIFADLMNRTIMQIYKNYSSKEEVDLDSLSKNISNILKHLLDFLKIKEFLNQKSSEFKNFDEQILQNDKIQNAISDIRKELIKML